MPDMTLPDAGDMVDFSSTPYLASALMGTIGVSADTGSAYLKELATYAGKSVYGAAQAGQAEAGQ